MAGEGENGGEGGQGQDDQASRPDGRRQRVQAHNATQTGEKNQARHRPAAMIRIPGASCSRDFAPGTVFRENDLTIFPGLPTNELNSV